MPLNQHAKVIYPIQSWGLGDVIWEQTLVKKLAQGKPIIWPVEPEFTEGLNRAYPDVLFIPRSSDELLRTRKDDYVEAGIRYLPLRWADSICKVQYSDCMKSKYLLYGMDFNIWKEHAMWQRDRQKEDELYKLMGCDKRSYAFINCTFGSQSQLRVPIPSIPHLPIVEMQTIAGFSLFDWAKIWENATEFHSVSTSIIYCIEQLDLRAEKVHLYCRKPIEKNFDTIEYILQKHSYVCHL